MDFDVYIYWYYIDGSWRELNEQKDSNYFLKLEDENRHFKNSNIKMIVFYPLNL